MTIDEAFKNRVLPDTATHFDIFKAGYAAALAAMKEGGPVAEVVSEWVDSGDYDQGNELICKPRGKLVLGDKFYKLPEDEK